MALTTSPVRPSVCRRHTREKEQEELLVMMTLKEVLGGIQRGAKNKQGLSTDTSGVGLDFFFN